MNHIQLIALDMDGTVLDHKERISEQNRLWIRRALEQDVLVCFATGRGIHSVIPYVEELQLNTPMVLVNGSEVWKDQHELWSRQLLDPQEVVKLHELAMQYDVWFWAYAVDGVYNQRNWDQAHHKDWLKFGYYSEDLEKLQRIKEQLESFQRYEITNSLPENIEVNPLGVNKSAGLREVCERLGLQMSQVAAAGDSLNDLAMIREAGFGVAMGNAQQQVKQAADWVTATNVEDGVALMIQKILDSK